MLLVVMLPSLTRLQKNAHLSRQKRDFLHLSSLRRTGLHVSFLGISGTLHLVVRGQSANKMFFRNFLRRNGQQEAA
jgi:hypothetical protein